MRPYKPDLRKTLWQGLPGRLCDTSRLPCLILTPVLFFVVVTAIFWVHPRRLLSENSQPEEVPEVRISVEVKPELNKKPLPGGIQHKEVLEGFKNWYLKVEALKADFHQYTYNPIWGEEQEATGDFYFKRPGNMRWEYKSPHNDIIIVNEEGFFWYTPEDKQVVIKKKDEVFQEISPMSILGEKMDLEKNFDIVSIEQIKEENGKEEGGGYSILLKPKEPKVAVKNIRIRVRAKEFSLAAIEVEELAENRNRIEFEKIDLTPSLGPDLFILTPPPGVKLITPNDFPLLN